MVNITCGADDFLHGVALILRIMASILSDEPDILPCPTTNVFGFSKGKIHFFPKVLKNWSSSQKTDYHFLGGGGQTFTFLNPFLLAMTHNFCHKMHYVYLTIEE